MAVSGIAPVTNDNQKILRLIDPLRIRGRIVVVIVVLTTRIRGFGFEFSISPIGSVVQSNSTPAFAAPLVRR